MVRVEDEHHLVPETKVLAIASHVVSGYVGNKIAVFVLQSLGCDVAALNTVQFSNHTGYGQWTGTRTTAEEILSLYQGLKDSYLASFDMMLSGYIPGATGVEAVGRIARELAEKSGPGGFFWVLDPVMGDNGSLYVAEDVVPAYRNLVSSADLILPNQFEAELLSETQITSLPTLTRAIQTLHERYGVPHVVITSVSIRHPDQHPASTLSVVGSTMTSRRRARPFKIVFPAIDAYFSGTGDMFAALMVVRMREAVCDAVVGAEAKAKADAEADALIPVLNGLPMSHGGPYDGDDGGGEKVFALDVGAADLGGGRGGGGGGQETKTTTTTTTTTTEETKTNKQTLSGEGGKEEQDEKKEKERRPPPSSSPPRLTETRSWLSPDDVDALDLPLARAAERVLGSMHELLTRTRDAMVAEQRQQQQQDEDEAKEEEEEEKQKKKKTHLLKSKTAELRLVRNLSCLRQPCPKFKAQKI